MQHIDAIRTRILPLLSLLIPTAVLLVGCAEQDPGIREPIPEEPEAEIPEFPMPEFEEGRRLDTLFGVNLDTDSMPEYVVTSLAESGQLPGSVRADRIGIWDFDEKSAEWREVLVDTLLWLDSIQLVDMTRDDLPEIVALTFAGGNDEVAGRGISIYSGGDGTIGRLFERGGGMPRIVSIDGRHLLLLHTQYWPEFLPHAAAVPVPDELLGFEGGESRADYEVARSFFVRRGTTLKERVERLLDEYNPRGPGGSTDLLPPAEATELYSLVVEAIFTLRMGDAPSELRELESNVIPRLEGLLDEEQFMMIEDEFAGEASPGD